ncbi:MAG: hypothetical protein WKF53_17755, partial [Rubrobacter sp.]
DDGEVTWSGWLPTPHTSSLILAITLAVIGLVWAVARGRAPLNPMALGGLVAVLGLISGSRVFYRIVEPPFSSGPVEIGLAAYLSLLSAVVIVVSGIVYAVTQRQSMGARAPSRKETRRGPGEAASPGPLLF